MPKFYCIHYTEKVRLPKLTPEQAEGMKKALAEAETKLPGCKFIGVMWDPNTGIAVGEIEAPDLKAAQEFVKASNAPPSDIVTPVEPLAL